RARDLRADNHLIAFLQHVLDLDVEIGERRGQLRENLPGAGRSGRLIWSRRDVDPIFAQDPIEESGIPLAECVVPEQDVLLVPARVRGMRVSTDHRHSQKEKYIQAPFAPQGRPKARTAPPSGAAKRRRRERGGPFIVVHFVRPRYASRLNAPAPNATICSRPPAIATFLKKWTNWLR